LNVYESGRHENSGKEKIQVWTKEKKGMKFSRPQSTEILESQDNKLKPTGIAKVMKSSEQRKEMEKQ
jgi:hypothetical protein